MQDELEMYVTELVHSIRLQSRGICSAWCGTHGYAWWLVALVHFADLALKFQLSTAAGPAGLYHPNRPRKRRNPLLRPFNSTTGNGSKLVERNTISLGVVRVTLALFDLQWTHPLGCHGNALAAKAAHANISSFSLTTKAEAIDNFQWPSCFGHVSTHRHS
eukprot:s1201_g7.t1